MKIRKSSMQDRGNASQPGGPSSRGRRISRLLFLLVFGFKFGCMGLEKQAFGMEGIAKINFRRNWISCDSRVDFHDFG